VSAATRAPHRSTSEIISLRRAERPRLVECAGNRMSRAVSPTRLIAGWSLASSSRRTKPRLSNNQSRRAHAGQATRLDDRQAPSRERSSRRGLQRAQGLDSGLNRQVHSAIALNVPMLASHEAVRQAQAILARSSSRSGGLATTFAWLWMDSILCNRNQCVCDLHHSALNNRLAQEDANGADLEPGRAWSDEMVLVMTKIELREPDARSSP